MRVISRKLGKLTKFHALTGQDEKGGEEGVPRGDAPGCRTCHLSANLSRQIIIFGEREI